MTIVGEGEPASFGGRLETPVSVETFGQIKVAAKPPGEMKPLECLVQRCPAYCVREYLDRAMSIDHDLRPQSTVIKEHEDEALGVVIRDRLVDEVAARPTVGRQHEQEDA
jgi:hypothetical protein